jgi:hypothetical protein
MDDARLKNGGNNNYFDELLARIRDIRASEKLFYQKILEIYATSVDYDPKVAESKNFFKLFKIRCTGQRMGTLLRKLYMPV